MAYAQRTAPGPRAFTIVELLVVVAIISLLIAILLPALGRARDAALVTQSLGNLRNLSAANATYGADYADRQFQATPDDVGAFGSCQNYLQTACLPAVILGWQGQTQWSISVGPGPVDCPGLVGCDNFFLLEPGTFETSRNLFGAWRAPSVQGFSNYLNGRYYDKAFFAPKDLINLELADPYINSPDSFSYVDTNGIVFPTYCFSPAAMWGPDVLSRKGFRDPRVMPAGYRAPAVGQAAYPELKTRMIEHQWLQNQDGGPTNPSFEGGSQPWIFNQGINSNPNALFFDGHVASIACSEVMDADRRIRASWNGVAGAPPVTGRGLWHTGTPYGTNGYYQQFSFDMLVDTSFHVLTTDGIRGRDILGAK
jgi:prepilin-type N-terminal cleavage/methylation domain-containing protein/prepilin-type processing-associated H-X9-DG protein